MGLREEARDQGWERAVEEGPVGLSSSHLVEDLEPSEDKIISAKI